ncbi:MAG: YoaK family protein [Candidatus Nitrosopolaris sp.]|jgi:hypothetical protein
MNNPSDDTPKDPESTVGINSARGQTLIVRNTLVVVLAFTSGFIDALAFLRVGVFASVQTANTVLLGLAFGSGNILSGMYETSQNQLHSAEEELDRMKQYLNEVLKEVAVENSSEKVAVHNLFYINYKTNTVSDTHKWNSSSSL